MVPNQDSSGDSGEFPTYSRILGIICVGIAIVVLISSTCLFSLTGRTVPFDYGIVVDAGSSHTQFFLYQWLGDKDSGTGNVSQEDTCIYEHGIANIPDPTVVIECATKVVKSIPNVKQLQTPLYFAATAGMRLLNYTDPEEVNLRLLSLKYALKLTGVNVKDVSVISGRDEGLYSWITVNFLQGSLNPRKAIHSWNATYGALDLGGASTQFSYAVNQTFYHADEVTHLKLYGNEYDVFSKSFLCFGSDQAFMRHQALLIKDFNSSDIIGDPCLPKGNLSTSAAITLLGSPCTSNPLFKHWLKIYDSENKTFTFKGTSDFKLCKASIENLLNETSCNENGFMKCPKKVNIASSHLQFFAFSSFAYVTSFLNATNVSLDEMITITEKWCKLSWEEINEHKYKPSIRPYLTRYCFGGLYITQWLTGIYGFNNTSWKKLIFQDVIGNSDIGWSLGYMVNATNAIPEEKMSDPVISLAVLVLLILGSLLLFSVGFVFVGRYFKFRKTLHYSQFDNVE